MAHTISIDIGTTNIKAVLFDDSLNGIASAAADVRTYYDQPGFAEQDPDEILKSVLDLVSEVLMKAEGQICLEYIAFSSACTV